MDRLNGIRLGINSQVLKITVLNPQLEMDVHQILRELGLTSRWIARSELFACLDTHGRVEGIACTKVFGEDCLLLLVAVRQGVQRKGRGSALVNHVLGYYAGNCKRVYALAAGAESFFLRFGFQAVPAGGLPETITGSPELGEHLTPEMAAMVRSLPRKTVIT
ncbi:MAG: GNAT family N-acetyltransferase [bacterium]|nr:MAG: GNAT family N-acetyltransferase [bacterium]